MDAPFSLPQLLPCHASSAAVPGCSFSRASLVLNSALIPPTAGLSLLNISLDTLQPERFVAMTRRQGHERVMACIWKAVQLGFDPGQCLSTAQLGRVAWQGLYGMRETCIARLLPRASGWWLLGRQCSWAAIQVGWVAYLGCPG